MIQSRRPRILHVVRTLAVGGLEVGVVNLVRGLDECGFEQAILCLERPGVLASQVIPSVPVWSCATERRGLWNRHELRASYFIRKFQPDIVHARNFGAWIDAVFARLLAGCPGKMAFSVHGWESAAAMPRRRTWWCRMLARMTHAMAAVSNQTASDFAHETGIPRSRFTELATGVDTQRFRPRVRPPEPDSPIVIGCVARLAPVKGLDVLVTAFEQLKHLTHRPVELRFIGDGPVRADLQAQVEQLGISASVKFLGNRDDLPELLRELDFFALPSLREGRPTSIMEAMAVGLPIVATTVGSIPQLVEDGLTGILIPPNDVEALAQALARMVNDDTLRTDAGVAARQKAVHELSIDNMIRNYAQFYRNLMPSKRTVCQHLDTPSALPRQSLTLPQVKTSNQMKGD